MSEQALIQVLRGLDRQERSRFLMAYARAFGRTAEIVRRPNNSGYVYRTPRQARRAKKRKDKIAGVG